MITMGRPSAKLGSTMAREAIEDHITAARELTANDRVVLESAFTLACSSPFVASVGY